MKELRIIVAGGRDFNDFPLLMNKCIGIIATVTKEDNTIDKIRIVTQIYQCKVFLIMEMRKQIFRVKGSEIIKIKDKLKKWLLADELLKIQDIESKYNELKDSVARAEDLLHKAYGNYLKAESVAENTVKLADDCRKLMNDICDVGVDVARDKYHSWRY